MYRLVRDTELSARMKGLYGCCCQICGVRVETAAGPYAEAAHILPLGQGYDGPDIDENILCLCPNDHVRLDHGSLFVLDDHRIIDAKGNILGKLTVHPQHRLEQIYFKAHRRMFGHD
jgi:putative restriction endonuclease